jgi:hypothetical protein
MAMTTEPRVSLFDPRSFPGVSASAASAVLAGFLCADAPPWVAGVVPATAAAIPAAIEYSIRSRRRDKAEDAARIRQGDLRRPVALVVVMMAAAVILLITLTWIVFGVFEEYATLAYADWIAIIGNPLIPGVCAFFIAAYGSHYFGKRPYLYTSIAFGCAFIYQLLMYLVVFEKDGSSALEILMVFGAFNVVYLSFALAGVRVGRNRHAKFLAKKLERIERKASRAAAAQQQSKASGPDPLDQLKKLGDLRDAGVVTQEEFQAKKAEILGRI